MHCWTNPFHRTFLDPFVRNYKDLGWGAKLREHSIVTMDNACAWIKAWENSCKEISHNQCILSNANTIHLYNWFLSPSPFLSTDLHTQCYCLASQKTQLPPTSSTSLYFIWEMLQSLKCKTFKYVVQRMHILCVKLVKSHCPGCMGMKEEGTVGSKVE